MTQSLTFREMWYRVKTSKYIREFQRPVLALPLPGPGNLGKLFYLPESNFSDLVNMEITRNIPVLLFTAAGMIK